MNSASHLAGDNFGPNVSTNGGMRGGGASDIVSGHCGSDGIDGAGIGGGRNGGTGTGDGADGRVHGGSGAFCMGAAGGMVRHVCCANELGGSFPALASYSEITD